MVPRKKEMSNMIQTRESPLYKLRKIHMTKKLKEVCQLDSIALIHSHSLI
jgi:hypothetical protein